MPPNSSSAVAVLPEVVYTIAIQGGLDALFRDDANALVTSDPFSYPVSGDNKASTCPDVFVVFGRTAGDRNSDAGRIEDRVVPRVVFQVASLRRRIGAMLNKFFFYERYGAEEYYHYDPDRGELSGWLRSADELREIENMAGWVSPRLKVRFELVDGELNLYGPDGCQFPVSATSSA